MILGSSFLAYVQAASFHAHYQHFLPCPANSSLKNNHLIFGHFISLVFESYVATVFSIEIIAYHAHCSIETRPSFLSSHCHHIQLLADLDSHCRHSCFAKLSQFG